MADSKISSYAEDTAPDPAADFVEIVDVSAGDNKKVLLKNIFGGFKGALVKKSVDQTAADYSAGAIIAWDAETYDFGAWHDNVTNNSRLTVPSGVTKVRVVANIRATSLTADIWTSLTILKNGSDTFDGASSQASEIGLTTINSHTITPVLEVTAGDYFEVRWQVETDNSITIQANRSSFSIEAVN